MKYFLSILLFLLPSGHSFAQINFGDTLKKELSQSKKEDISRVLILGEIADYYGFIQFDSCLFYAAQTIALAKKINFPYGLSLGYFSTFHGLNCQGNYTKAFEALVELKRINEQLKKDSPRLEAQPYYLRGLLYREMGDDQNAIDQFQLSLKVQEKSGEPLSERYFSYSQLAMIYIKLQKLDSALVFAKKGYNLGVQAKRWMKYYSLAIGALGRTYLALQNYGLAGELFRKAIAQSGFYNNIYFQTRNYNNLATMFNQMKVNDSCIYYAGISFKLCQDHNFTDFALEASQLLSNAYSSERKSDSALKYMKIFLEEKDSVFSQSNIRQFQQAKFDEIQRQQEINIVQERYHDKVRFYSLLAVVGVFLLLAFLLYLNTREKQKAKIKIEKAYEELKSTQAQLIQSEKMASLGELTAGIAHEIQNPLNFVNNFSELNKELIDEAYQAIKAGNTNEAIELLSSLRDNEEKISNHGQRADSIVKGMLQHSRTSAGQKEATEINALADEYLRLSYHGLRAKDKSFNATMQTDFDPTIGKINIVPQDIGRVMLNLYNNAFYAILEKVKRQTLGYEPRVSVSTKRSGDKIKIMVKDNGIGIPQKVIDKIFQPFFTTKPAGQGTGLGLSMSYDIIKAHGGELKVESKEGEWTEFVVLIPIA
jgi:two-component system, NtrC family, sensor kinase